MRWVLGFIFAFSSFTATVKADDTIELRSIYGRNYNLAQLLKRDEKLSVFVFARVGCPAVDLISTHLADLYAKYRKQKVAFYLIYSYAGTDIRKVAAHSYDLKIPYRAFLDVNQNLAKLWKIDRTATAVLVDGKQTRLYTGAVLDGERAGHKRGAYLEDAIEATLRSRPVAVAETKAQGCVIRTKATEPIQGLTFHKDILPIVQAKCQRCHRPGEVAPFSLLTYSDFNDNSPTIAQVVEDRTMPPWPAESKLHFLDDASLSDAEVHKILSYIQTGEVEGKPADGPAPITWPAEEEWAIGKPDFVFESRPYNVPATGLVPYIYTRRPIKADEELWLEALEVHPGQRRAVHHMAIHEYPYSTKPISAADIIKIYGLEFSNPILGAYVPGIKPRIMPPGHAMKIQKGMGVLIDAHYTPFGQAVTDVTRVAFKVSKTPPEREVFTRWFYRSRGRFYIPANEDHTEMMRDDISFEKDIEILGMRPHLHARGKNFRVERLDFAGTGEFETLLSLPRWDFNWQYDYMLEKPLLLKGGQSLRITATWDNTDFNPTNPDPNIPGLFGEQTTDEMMGLLLIWRDAKKETVNP